MNSAPELRQFVLALIVVCALAVPLARALEWVGDRLIRRLHRTR